MTDIHHRTMILMAAVALLAAACGSAEPAVPAPTNDVTTKPTATSTPANDVTTEPTATSAPDDARTLVVPGGGAPMIDGTIEPAEWEGAAVTVMDDGTELKWLHTGGFLYVGILNDTIGAANLAVTGEDYVRILHSSAALGSASYQRQADGTWHLEHGFEWCCRNPADPNDGDLLLADEGWLANIGFVGAPGHIEYQLMLDAGELRVAISYAYTIDSVAFWPADLPTADRESLYGYREDQETFTVETWMLVVPAD